MVGGPDLGRLRVPHPFKEPGLNLWRPSEGRVLRTTAPPPRSRRPPSRVDNFLNGTRAWARVANVSRHVEYITSTVIMNLIIKAFIKIQE